MIKLSRTVLLLAATGIFAAGCDGESPASQDTNSQNAASKADPKEATKQTIGQSLGQNAELSSFTGALKTAGLDTTLTGNQPYTVFAPSNAAFQKLPNAQALMQPDAKGRLTDTLTYHIVPGVVTAKDLQAAIEKKGGKAEIATVGGANLTASNDGGTIVITDVKGGQARVSQADMLQSNGVVHVVDTVLSPS